MKKVKIYKLVDDHRIYNHEDIWTEYKWDIGQTGTIEEWKKRAIDWLRNEEEDKTWAKELKKLSKDKVIKYISDLYGLDFQEFEDYR